MSKYLFSAVLVCLLAGSMHAETITTYYSIDCAGFQPHYSNQEYANGGDYLHATNDIGFNGFVATVSLPDSAVVTEFTAYVYDTDVAEDITVALAVCAHASLSRDIMAQVTSSGSSGIQGLADTAISYDVIDNSAYRYYVGLQLPSGDETHRMLGVRIKYEVSTTGTQEASQSSNRPAESVVFQNYPNPVYSETTIEYNTSQKGQVTLKVYNEAGQLVRVLVDGLREPGKYSVPWDGRNDRGEKLPSGCYFYQVLTGGFSSARKMVVVE